MKLTRLNQILDEGRIIKGSWELNDKHEVFYKGEGKDEEFKLKASILGAEPGALLLTVTERQTDQKIVTSILKLSGAWRLDPTNRINFEVESEKSKQDTLVFKGGWEVGGSNEIIYTYERKALKKGPGESKSLIFRGHWDIDEDRRLTYHIGQDSHSAFKIRGAFQTKSILAKKGEIRYQAGAEVIERRKAREITLFGKWKLSRDLELSFEMEYENRKKKAINFGSGYSLTKDRRIEISLKNEKGKAAAIELVLTRDFLAKDGQTFLRILKSGEESRLEAGMKFAI